MYEEVYLRPEVYLEPLINGWFARPQLVSPATGAMNLKNRFIRIMKSYVGHPAAHAMAVQNPELMGGFFLDYPQEKVNDIKDLLDRTLAEHADLIELSEAITSLDRMLAAEAKGSSLETFYSRVPEPLRGYVELCYDLNDHPSIRFIEPLLYQSRFYKPESQRIALGLIDGDHRPFVLSTPRLPNDRNLHLHLPFASPLVDELFEMRRTPRSRSVMLSKLEAVRREGGLDPRALFTTEAPSRPRAYEGDGVRIRYFGHACVLIESRQTSVLIDPVISYADPGTGVERFTFADLPETIDYVLVTHAHQDHFMLETLLQLRARIRTILVPANNRGSLADPSLCLMLKVLGFSDAREIDELDRIETPGGFIMGLPFLGEHADLNVHSKLAYVVNLEGRGVMLAADASNPDPRLYEHVRRVCGEIEILFLGMECVGAPMSWLYGPLLTRPVNHQTDQSRRLNGSDYDRALALVNSLNAQAVYIYALGQEPWLNYFMSVAYDEQSPAMVQSQKLMLACLSRGLTCDRPHGKMELMLENEPVAV